MERKYHDLCVLSPEKELLNKASSMGWDGLCVVQNIEDSKKQRNIPNILEKTEIYSGALISNDVEKNARKALDNFDLVLVSGGDDEVNRAASECWEVDILLHPEKGREKDHMDYRNGGLDHVMASFMAERAIALGVDFSELTSCSGRMFTQILGRIRQNIRIALKYNVPVVLASCAKDKLGLRSPLDMAALHSLIGVPEHLAIKVISEYPSLVVKKMKDRKNPNIIINGLEVVEWGGQKPSARKRMYGWY